MIYVYDNGEEYSDHSIEFIESDYPEPEHVVASINAYQRTRWGHGDPEPGEGCVATAPSLDWRDGCANETLEDWLSPSRFFDGYPGTESEVVIEIMRGTWKGLSRMNMQQYHDTPKPLIDWLCERWPRMNSHGHDDGPRIDAIRAYRERERSR
jgi:hypothetical protein